MIVPIEAIRMGRPQRRISPNTIANFASLIAANTHVPDPILVDDEMHLIDGLHRLVMFQHLNCGGVQVRVIPLWEPNAHHNQVQG